MRFNDQLHAFYRSHKEDLEKSYPGINERIFQNYFEDVFSYIIYQPKILENYFEKIKRGIPLEYIFRKAFFYELNFEINEFALIPRFETEILVHETIEFIKKNEVNSILDLGTGPGTILLNIAYACPEVKYLLGSDIDEKVLQLAKRNLFLKRFRFSQDQKINFMKSDRFEKIHEHFDVIVSNPPYIKREAQSCLVHDRTHQYEPHLALYLDDIDYYKWFEVLFHEVDAHLNERGLFFMEGHENELKKLAHIASDCFSEIEVIKDLSNRDRFLKIRKI
ncbi:MAG: peptide chain release factor N(5)-glutamine methyltransferase [Halobacteriovoraceae bacterium]|nr:peptide chain release factor N(5)-glutamine methyltransferase [Halobacteriovoraceae bacterium]